MYNNDCHRVTTQLQLIIIAIIIIIIIIIIKSYRVSHHAEVLEVIDVIRNILIHFKSLQEEKR